MAAHQEALMRLLLLMVIAASAVASDIYDTPEGRWEGHWLDVAATAYTPTNAIDSAYHESKGTRWRWILADGRTHAKRTPYGVAVKLFEGGDGKWRPALPFGTRLYIPLGSGYLDRSRASERIFTVDDGSASSRYRPTMDGHLHIDLRWVDDADAIRWSGPQGHRTLRVFVIERELPRMPEPEQTWPEQVVECELPALPSARANEPEPQPRVWQVALLLLPASVLLMSTLMIYGARAAA